MSVTCRVGGTLLAIAFFLSADVTEARESPSAPVECVAVCKACEAPSSDLTALERTLVGMQPDSWYEHPDSNMRGACPDRVRGNCKAVITAWSGGALDASRGRLLVWGGGHSDYYGNELFAFDIAQGQWRRLTEPSRGQGHSRDPLEDGNPAARHTYDGMEVIDHAHRLFAHGGSRAGDGWATRVTWTFDLKTHVWRNDSPSPSGPGGLGQASAYDPESRRVLYRSRRALHAFDLENGSWKRLADFTRGAVWPRYERGGNKTGALDSRRGLFWSVGGGDVLVWDIRAGRLVTDRWKTTGAGTYSNRKYVGRRLGQIFEGGGGRVYDAQGPGFDYDAVADELVAWANRGGPYLLDLETRQWRRGSGDGAPVSRTSGGTFGRWRYVPDYNVHVLVTSVDANVHFYKNKPCKGG